MTNQSILAEFMNGVSPSLYPSKRDSGVDKGSQGQFRDFLNRAVTEKSRNFAAAGTPSRWEKSSSIEENPVRNYGEAKRSSDSQGKTATLDNRSKLMTKEDFLAKGRGVLTEDSSDSDEMKGEAVVGALAEIFNIRVNDMKNILDSVNIQAVDLTDSNKIKDAADKLSLVMGLTEGQKTLLNEMLDMVKNQVDVSFQQALSNPDTLKPPAGIKDKPQETNWIKVENVDLDVVRLEDAPEALKRLFNAVNQRLEELSNQSKGTLLEEIQASVEKTVETLKNDMGLRKEGKTAEAENPEESPSDAQPIKSEAGELKESLDSRNNAKEEDDGGNEGKRERYPGGPVKAEENQGYQPVKVLNTDSQTITANPATVAPVAKGSEVQEAFKLTQTNAVTKEDILSQVIHKASVVTNGEKSEMVMDLKPDYLGKLSLKVVTENGIVMAKFIAESQRVKEVLETNMQLLKDTLEKQGLSVQGFSVSVGQDSARQSNGNGSFDRFGKGRPSGWRNTPSPAMSTTESLNSEMRSNPYEWGGSKINLTA